MWERDLSRLVLSVTGITHSHVDPGQHGHQYEHHEGQRRGIAEVRHALAQGAIHAVQENGLLGAFTGGITAAAGGITAAICFGFLAAVLFRAKPKT